MMMNTINTMQITQLQNTSLNLINLNRDNKIKLEVKQLKESYIPKPSKLTGKKLTRRTYSTQRMGVVDDDIWSLDQYYISLINEVLINIRKRQPAWVFNTDQLKDVLRFEPYVEFEYDDDDEVIYIWR